MQVFAKLTNGRTLTLEVEDYMTGAAVKQLILEQEKVAVKRLMVMELVNKEVADNRALGYYLPRAGLIIDPETGVLTGTTTVEGVEGESSVSRRWTFSSEGWPRTHRATVPRGCGSRWRVRLTPPPPLSPPEPSLSCKARGRTGSVHRSTASTKPVISRSRLPFSRWGASAFSYLAPGKKEYVARGIFPVCSKNGPESDD